MSEIHSFQEIYEHLGAQKRRCRIAVVCPDDECTRHAILEALKFGMADFLLVSSAEALASLPMEIIDNDAVITREADTPDEAAYVCVEAVRRGEAQILMKGLINTDNYLRAILNKEHGLLPKGAVLTHLSVAQLSGYHKLLFFSDVAVIPCPTLEQKTAMIRYDLDTIRRFGIECPKVALIHFTEKVNEKFPNSVMCIELEKMASGGEFGQVEMGGPMDVKAACNRHSAEVKGITSPMCGDADLLIFPNIESANTFYKTISLFGGADIAGVLQGAICPVVLSSRSDSAASKLSSMALACVSAN